MSGRDADEEPQNNEESTVEITQSPLDQRLMELAVAGRLGELHEDESKAWVQCRRCGNEHLGELYESPPDGFYVQYFCLRSCERGRKSYL